MHKTLLFAAMLATTPLVAEEHPADAIVFTTPQKITMSVGREAPFEIAVKVPDNHHIYLRHANKKGNAILVKFSLPGAAAAGFEFSEESRPRGQREGNEMVLRGSGKFRFKVAELAQNEFGTTHDLKLSVRVQICGEGSESICYMPVELEKKIHVELSEPEFLTRDLPDTSLPWIMTYDAAMAAAKAKGKNVFGLISSPERCGACVHLEKNVLPDASVQKLLKGEFVLYRVPRNEIRKAPVSGRFGIPFYFIISPTGDNLAHWSGAPAAAPFIERIKPYATAQATPPVAPAQDANYITLNSGGECKIPLKQSIAYQALQKGDFKTNGNMRFVPNASEPGKYTLLTLDRTGEIETAHNAVLVNGALQVENYLRQNPLSFQCSGRAVTGGVSSEKLEIQLR